MAAPTNLNIPASDATVSVSIINTGARIRLPLAGFMEPPIEGHTHLDAPAYSFLIEHPQHGKLLFDLSIRKDWKNLAPAIVGQTDGDALIEVEKDVLDVLEENGIASTEIKSVIWSHWHCDHIGDSSRLASSTELVLGKGFLDALTPGYPVNPNSPFLESDYKGRKIREIDFSTHPNRLQLGRFDAIDFFGDGSFYLINTPGHALGHVCGLSRTTPTTFILTGGDAAGHHGGELRPSPYLPLPSHLSPSPFSLPRPFQPGTACPGSLLEQRIQAPRGRDPGATTPFYKLAPTGMPDFELDVAQATVDWLAAFDGDERVLVVTAHDAKLKGVVEFFPKTANAWRERGWKAEGLWRFLEDFKGAVGEEGGDDQAAGGV
ncbi:metallo-beta-lactamase superfamily protein [Diplodia corticola]|uniref:Metallo-beta-lactamase superfamily protein n=1 Tax=Diplodia corticola TaxID=236234 RepID=A0A1J9QNN5_9PEZI|nr:metallo-beta-lactamase superfamily protein [Diplodia corticola]OJD29674.1 metallo-beta-lactamase superfamily protein [Diplodia corticola]